MSHDNNTFESYVLFLISVSMNSSWRDQSTAAAFVQSAMNCRAHNPVPHSTASHNAAVGSFVPTATRIVYAVPAAAPDNRARAPNPGRCQVFQRVRPTWLHVVGPRQPLAPCRLLAVSFTHLNIGLRTVTD